MKGKNKKKTEQVGSGSLLVDEEKFTNVIRKMVNTPPVPLKKLPKRKNPHKKPILPASD